MNNTDEVPVQVDITHYTSLEMPSGETYTFNKKIETEDMSRVHDIWSEFRTEELQRIEQDAKYKILAYLKSKGYSTVILEKVKFQ